MGTSELKVSLPCDCGKSVVARAKDAGGFIACLCGNLVAVPKLSELRLLSGADAFVTNPAEAIAKAQRDGKEPAGDNCLLCGSARPAFYEYYAACEQSHTKNTGPSKSTEILRWLLLPFIVNILLSSRRDEETIERQGHDIEVTIRLPVCDLCKSGTGKPTRVSVAKDLMIRVPLYKQLLDYYPDLSLSIDRA